MPATVDVLQGSSACQGIWSGVRLRLVTHSHKAVKEAGCVSRKMSHTILADVMNVLIRAGEPWWLTVNNLHWESTHTNPSTIEERGYFMHKCETLHGPLYDRSPQEYTRGLFER